MTLIFPTDFRKIHQHNISWYSVQWEPSCSGQTDRWTDMAKLIVVSEVLWKRLKLLHFYFSWIVFFQKKILRERANNGNFKRIHSIPLGGELAVEVAMDLSQCRLRNEYMNTRNSQYFKDPKCPLLLHIATVQISSFLCFEVWHTVGRVAQSV
jgi:hypothetical protein